MLHRSGMQIMILNLNQVKEVSPIPNIIVPPGNLAKSVKWLSSKPNCPLTYRYAEEYYETH